jgi:HEAT repeat protein
MKNTKLVCSLTVCLAFLAGALLIAGCAGAHSPRGLADRALAPANDPEAEREQEKAMVELISLPPDTSGLKEALRRILKESDKPKIRAQAIAALAGMKDRDSIPAIIERVKSEDKQERARAALAAGQMLKSNLSYLDSDGHTVLRPEDADMASRENLAKRFTEIYGLYKMKWDSEGTK